MGKATIHNENNFENYENFEIQTKKIDELNFDNKISFIKIDVEGHELEVIEGGKNTIKRDKDVITRYQSWSVAPYCCTFCRWREYNR